MVWKVQIVGDDFDLAELARSVNSAQMSLTKERDSYYLNHESFQECQTHMDVLEKASRLIAILNGATRLAIGGHSTLREAGLVRENPDGTRTLYDAIHETMGLRDSLTATAVDAEGKTLWESYPADGVPIWVALSLRDEAVEKVMRLFAQSHDWVNLYRIYEVVEQDVGGEKAIEESDWAGKFYGLVKTFKRTANSPGAIGDEARHGKETTTPPPKPMLFAEARALIEALIQQWLRSHPITHKFKKPNKISYISRVSYY